MSLNDKPFLFPLRPSVHFSVLSVVSLFTVCTMHSVWATDETWETEWGGHARGIATASEPGEQSIYQFVDTSTAYDGQGELRVKNRTFMGSDWSTEAHYELVALGGDTLERNNALDAVLPAETTEQLLASQVPDDQTRLMNLTRRFSASDRSTAYHRLDRLNVNYAGSWGSVRLGRQALTWGDGLLFNPMDLFNPFAPTTVQRDYKTGDDMAHLQLPFENGNLQFLHVPRRDALTGEVDSDQSSAAVKWHGRGGSLEADAMLAAHYDDRVVGLGASGYLGGAVWRMNSVYTRLANSTGHDSYIQFVANLDYAWAWRGKNVYGLIEVYYNELGVENNYAAALTDPAVFKRLQRGELFTLGKRYLAGGIQLEWHPLVQVHVTSIINIDDPSGIMQPQVLWDMSDNLQLIAGASWHWGGANTEFGGFDTTANNTEITVAPDNQVYVWLTRHF